jgi:hypothetical protein
MPLTSRRSIGEVRWTIPIVAGVESDPLLERERELAAISRYVDAARAGEGGSVMLEGPAGIGKTALLTAACKQARRAGMATLTARAAELESALPWPSWRPRPKRSGGSSSPARLASLESRCDPAIHARLDRLTRSAQPCMVSTG